MARLEDGKAISACATGGDVAGDEVSEHSEET